MTALYRHFTKWNEWHKMTKNSILKNYVILLCFPQNLIEEVIFLEKFKIQQK